MFYPAASVSWQLNKYADGHLNEQAVQHYQATTTILTAIMTVTTVNSKSKPYFYELKKKIHYEKILYVVAYYSKQ